MDKDEFLFKVAATLVVLMSIVLFAVIFAVLFIGMPGWYAACYGIVYCAGTGFMAERFIIPKVMKKPEENTVTEEVNSDEEG